MLAPVFWDSSHLIHVNMWALESLFRNRPVRRDRIYFSSCYQRVVRDVSLFSFQCQVINNCLCLFLPQFCVSVCVHLVTWQSQRSSCINMICPVVGSVVISATESEPAPPPLQEQEHQVQRVGATVCLSPGFKCVEFLHRCHSECDVSDLSALMINAIST